MGGWSPERPVPARDARGSCAGNEIRIETRKQKRPARRSPGEAELFTVSILHCTPVSPRIKKTFCCQQKTGSYPVDNIAMKIALRTVNRARIARFAINKNFRAAQRGESCAGLFRSSARGPDHQQD